MPGTVGVEGFGIAIAFQSGFFAAIREVDDSGMKRNAHETTNDASTVVSGHAHRTFIPSKLIDDGELKVTLLYDPSKAPPIDKAAETVTVSLPIPIGGLTAATLVGSGFLTESGQKIPYDNLMMQDVTIKKTGQWVLTPGT